MIVSGYSLHLYCCCAECKAATEQRVRNRTFAEYAEPKERQAFAAARAAGWRIDRKTSRCWAPGHTRRKNDVSA